jgi:hypothetical protein
VRFHGFRAIEELPDLFFALATNAFPNFRAMNRGHVAAGGQ